MKLSYIKTLFPVNTRGGGAMSHTTGVIKGLQNQENVGLKIISNEYLPSIEKEKITVLPFNPRFSKYNLFYLDEYLFQRKHRANFQKMIASSEYVYHRYSSSSKVLVKVALKLKKKLILEYNGSEYWTMKHWDMERKEGGSWLKFQIKKVVNYFRVPLVKKTEMFNLTKATFITTVSEPLKNEMVSRGIDANKILVNPNGVDETEFSPREKNTDLVKKYQLENKIVLGFIGTFGAWHGTVEIIDALGKLFEIAPELKSKVSLLMVGDGNLRPKVEEKIANYSLENQVVLTGMIPKVDAADYLSVCDVLLNATTPNKDGSEFFGSPTKLFEYMAMGKAIISTNFGQMGEILSHDRTALLIEPNDDLQFAKAMQELITDEEKRTKLGSQAREELVAEHTWNIHVQRILDFVKNN